MAKRYLAPDEGDFLVVSLDGERIDGAAHFRAPPAGAYRSASSRAVCAGSKRFLVYQITADGKGALAFEQVKK